jgi:hypothetical protein
VQTSTGSSAKKPSITKPGRTFPLGLYCIIDVYGMEVLSIKNFELTAKRGKKRWK